MDVCCRGRTRTGDLRNTATLCQLSFTAYHFLYCLLPSIKLCEAATPRFCLCRHYPSPAIWAHALLVLALRLSVNRSLNTPLLPWLIRPTSHIPTLPSALHYYLSVVPVAVSQQPFPAPSREALGFGTYPALLCRTPQPSFMLPLSLPYQPDFFRVSFDAVSRWSLSDVVHQSDTAPPCCIFQPTCRSRS